MITQEPLDESLLDELKKAFMDAYDNNRDGRIDIRELAQLLPIEESFKLLFKFENQVESSVEFMKVSSLLRSTAFSRHDTCQQSRANPKTVVSIVDG